MIGRQVDRQTDRCETEGQIDRQARVDTRVPIKIDKNSTTQCFHVGGRQQRAGVTSDGQADEEGRTARGTVDDREGDMRRRGARECEEALMEATEARRGYARVAAWDELPFTRIFFLPALGFYVYFYFIFRPTPEIFQIFFN